MSARVLVATGLAIAALGLSACATQRVAAPATDEGVPAHHFSSRLTPYCGRAFPGKVIEDRPASPEAIWQEPALLFIRCERDGKVLALSLGEDRSRVWALGSTPVGFRLSHMHNHPDGSPDKVTGYGGVAIDPARSATRVEFPADASTQALFREHGMDEAVSNVWALELADENTLVYELKRPRRVFRMAFDLSSPEMPPPPPWAEMAVR